MVSTPLRFCRIVRPDEPFFFLPLALLSVWPARFPPLFQVSLIYSLSSAPFHIPPYQKLYFPTPLSVGHHFPIASLSLFNSDRFPLSRSSSDFLLPVRSFNSFPNRDCDHRTKYFLFRILLVGIGLVPTSPPFLRITTLPFWPFRLFPFSISCSDLFPCIRCVQVILRIFVHVRVMSRFFCFSLRCPSCFTVSPNRLVPCSWGSSRFS